MKVLLSAFTALVLASLASPLFAEEWSRARIEKLPDSAFASVEIDGDGNKVRHLPHHNEQGEIDVPHLRAALSRIGQVKWLDRASEAAARRHLEEHWRELKFRP